MHIQNVLFYPGWSTLVATAVCHIYTIRTYIVYYIIYLILDVECWVQVRVYSNIRVSKYYYYYTCTRSYAGVYYMYILVVTYIWDGFTPDLTFWGLSGYEPRAVHTSPTRATRPPHGLYRMYRYVYGYWFCISGPRARPPASLMRRRAQRGRLRQMKMREFGAHSRVRSGATSRCTAQRA